MLKLLFVLIDGMKQTPQIKVRMTTWNIYFKSPSATVTCQFDPFLQINSSSNHMQLEFSKIKMKINERFKVYAYDSEAC